MHVEVDSSAGMPLASVVVAPGVHGAEVAGTHGAGVKTPDAALVAAITAGFVGAEHMPKVGMFTIGLLSMMLATGAPELIILSGRTASDAGATPKEQLIMAPATTS